MVVHTRGVLVHTRGVLVHTRGVLVHTRGVYGQSLVVRGAFETGCRVKAGGRPAHKREGGGSQWTCGRACPWCEGVRLPRRRRGAQKHAPLPLLEKRREEMMAAPRQAGTDVH